MQTRDTKEDNNKTKDLYLNIIITITWKPFPILQNRETFVGEKSQQKFWEDLRQTKKNAEEEQSQIIQKKGSYVSSDM